MARKLEDMMQDLMVIQKNQMSSDELVKARIAKNEDLILGLANQYQGIKGVVVNLTDRLDNLELNEEITHEQNREFKEKAHSRVHQLINYNHEPQYFQVFIMDLYRYLRQNHQLGNPIAITRKKHYDTVMKGIEAWHPDIQQLKDKKDKADKLKMV